LLFPWLSKLPREVFQANLSCSRQTAAAKTLSLFGLCCRGERKIALKIFRSYCRSQQRRAAEGDCGKGARCRPVCIVEAKGRCD
jgi:hypothetical protein